MYTKEPYSHMQLVVAVMLITAAFLVVFTWFTAKPKHDTKIKSFTIQEKQFSLYTSDEKLPQILKNNKLWVDLKNLNPQNHIYIPPIAYKTMPQAIKNIKNTKTRKNTFISIVLPLILIAEQEITENKNFAIKMKNKLNNNIKLNHDENQKLTALFARYKCEFADFKSLMLRLDHIPRPLALAQAAVESGWGSARFTKVGNALFGQWTTSEYRGIIPKEALKGETYKIRSYDSLLESVRSYMLNLNTHNAYRELRQIRSQYTRKGLEPSSAALINALGSYAEKADYPQLLNSIIKNNRFDKINSAKLQP